MLKKGDIKSYRKVVMPEDIAAFPSEKNILVHDVYATFALARDMEWCSRLFVLDILKEDEEGIGTELQIKHIAPALVGEEVKFEAVISSFNDKGLFCNLTVKAGERLIAKGMTGQKIIKKNNFKTKLSGLRERS